MHVKYHFTCTAPPPILSTASRTVDVACFMLEKLEDLVWGQGLVSIGVQSMAMMLTSLLPDILILAITVFQVWKFEPSVPILEATIAAKDIKCTSFPVLALSTPMALMIFFLCLTLSVFACQNQTLTVLLVLNYLIYSILVSYICCICCCFLSYLCYILHFLFILCFD